MPDHAAPHIVTELPGPRAQQLIALDQQYTSPSYTRDYPLVAERGEGAEIVDVDGNRFLDFTAGIAVCSTGHCHPEVVAVIVEQAQRLLHMSGTDFYYRPQAELARKLAELAPCGARNRVFFTNSGTESVEAAIKLARRHTSRSQFVAFRGAFHGRTLGSLSLTGSKAVQRRGFAPLLPGVTHIDYPNCRSCPQAGATAGCCLRGLDDLERAFSQTLPPEEVAAIICEPIQGEGGYLVPPPEFFVRLSEIARRHGILLIADEVQSGMGRTGKMFACEHFGFEPDIVTTAKGIASGLPLGAMIARHEIMDWPPGSHASTFGGNPVSCVAALKTIELLESGLMENAARQGTWLIETLRRRAASLPAIVDVRGIGLMIGVELAEPATGRPAPELRSRVVQAAFRRGLLLLGCGVSTIRLCPPLVIDQRQAETAVELLCQALEEASHE
ncbi:MAG: acetyl ornithine aminotransferase family protein [Planctomycetales bacterium]|nr:acetyl ornithine aminotransferase family protein [Planctomycetales bacterium]